MNDNIYSLAWKTAKTKRLAPVIDGENYYSAVADTIKNAKETVFLAAWDIDSRIRLKRGKEDVTLSELLIRSCKNNPNLRIYILSWDFAILYALEREKLMGLKWNVTTPKNIRFFLDSEHPLGASHHQKILIADDSIAFCGGMDLSNSRWDTREHLEHHPERIDPMNSNYTPYHDVMFAVDSEAALCFSELFRNRWRHATGEELPKPQTNSDPWPKNIKPLVKDAEIGIFRTQPSYKLMNEAREIENAYLKIIANAEKYIYIENQYFTSKAIYQSVKERINDKDCPEILMILPLNSPGWLEESTMVNIRSYYIQELIQADKYNKLRFCRPHTGAEGVGFINIHAKQIIADNTHLFMGSANLSNRSMGFDTEANILLQASGDEKIEKSIEHYLYDLLAEHLGTDIDTVSKTMAETGSLFETVEKHSTEGKRLELIPNNIRNIAEKIVPYSSYIDPEKPALIDREFDQLAEPKDSDGHFFNVIKYFRAFMLLTAVIALGLAWKYTPLSEIADRQSILAMIQSVQAHPASVLIVICGFTLLGSILFPLTALVSATAAFYSPVEAFFISMTSSLLSATLIYHVGQAAGRKSMDRLLGKRSAKIKKVISGQGYITIALLRLVPVAPFTIVNAVAGALQIGMKKFFIGSLIGMTPGIIAVTAVTDRLIKSLFDPTVENMLILAAVVIFFFVTGYYITKRLSQKGAAEE